MREVLRKETAVQSGRTALRTDVADAMKRLWARDEHGRIPSWTPGSIGPMGGCLKEGVEMRELLEGGGSGCWVVGCLDGRFLQELDEATDCRRFILQTCSYRDR
jgi:hypothetical protein